MVKAYYDPKHPRGSRYRRTPPPEGKAPCCSSCEMYLPCQHGNMELEIVRDPSFAADSLAGEVNIGLPGEPELYHSVRMRLRYAYKIPDIKEYRRETGASLKEAKDYVEAQYDMRAKWIRLSDDCPRFGPDSSFWDEEVEMS